jgi:hypothetical protein
MHHKNNNNGAQHHQDLNADALRSQDPLLVSIGSANASNYSEATRAVMDEMSGTASSRRASVYNALRN